MRTRNARIFFFSVGKRTFRAMRIKKTRRGTGPKQIGLNLIEILPPFAQELQARERWAYWNGGTIIIDGEGNRHRLRREGRQGRIIERLERIRDENGAQSQSRDDPCTGSQRRADSAGQHDPLPWTTLNMGARS